MASVQTLSRMSVQTLSRMSAKHQGSNTTLFIDLQQMDFKVFFFTNKMIKKSEKDEIKQKNVSMPRHELN